MNAAPNPSLILLFIEVEKNTKINTVSSQMLVTFLNMSAYAQPTHFIVGTVKNIASVFHRPKNRVRRLTVGSCFI